MENTIRRYIEELVFDEGDAAEIGVQDDLIAVGLDSIGFMRLVSFIEETFAIDIPPEDVTIESFGTIRGITTYLQAREGASAQG